MFDTLLARLGSRVSRELAVFVAGFSLAIGVALMGYSFATVEGRQTKFGTALMPDFAAMYVAGTMLDRYGPGRLYDFPEQERVRREIFPHSPASERLPYVYAPWWAVVWIPFAQVSYETAGAWWLVASLALMAAGLACLARAFPEIPRRDMALVALLTLAFEPFLFECWANGQVSSFPFFCISAALMLESRGKPVAAGMMLALLTYKPMQPPLIFALLLFGRRWKTLAGVAAGGALIALVCVAAYGPGILLEYPQRLIEYGNLVGKTGEGGAQLRFWKYTDLQTAALLLGWPLETPVRIAAVPVALFLIASIAMLWRRAGEGWSEGARHAWAATLVLLPVLNFYYAVYDALLIVPGLLVAATLLDRGEGTRRDDGSMVLPAAFLGACALVYLAGILMPTFQSTRVNLMTLALLVLGWYVLRRIPVGSGAREAA